MKSLPEDFETDFGNTQLYAIGIDWGEGEEIYSTLEGPTIYSFVRDFSNYSSSTSVDGWNSSEINVTLLDSLGYFKEKLNTQDLYQLECNVYIATRLSSQFTLLFVGHIRDEVVWNEEEKTLTFDVVSKPIDFTIGYTPQLEDIVVGERDFYETRLSNESWPGVFGSVDHYPIVQPSQYNNVTLSTFYNYNGVGTYAFYYNEQDAWPVSQTGDEPIPFIFASSNFWVGALGFIKEDGQDNKYIEIVSTQGDRNFNTTFYTSIPFSGQGSIDAESGGRNTRVLLAPSMSTQGPMSSNPQNPWIKGMEVVIQSNFGQSIVQQSTTCVEQDGLLCTFTGILTLGSNNTIVRAGKSLAGVSTFPEGTRVSRADIPYTFVVDTKNDTSVAGLYVEDEDKLISIDEYTVKHSSLDDYVIPLNSHRPHTWVEINGWENIRWFSYESEQVPKLLCSATSEVDTDQNLINYVLGKNLEVAGAPINFVALDEEKAETLVPEVAWQRGKAVQVSETDITLVNLVNPPDPVYTFDDSNVLENSISIELVPFNDVVTVFNYRYIGKSYLYDIRERKLKKNVDKYGENEFDVDLYVYNDTANADLALQFWMDKLSSTRYYLHLTTFMGAFGLEVWDRVEVDLRGSNFIDELPLTLSKSKYEEPNLQVSGWVREVEPDQGLVNVKIEIDHT